MYLCKDVEMYVTVTFLVCMVVVSVSVCRGPLSAPVLHRSEPR